MAIAFTSDAAAGDTELVITLDLEGLQALFKATEAALETGQGDLSPQTCGGGGTTGGGPAKAFGKVTVKFVDPKRDARAKPTMLN
jgi:hypothetical protein